MTDRDGNRSNPYKPNPEMCCEACIFGSGEHAPWCENRPFAPCDVCGRVHSVGEPHYLPPCQEPGCTKAAEVPKGQFCRDHEPVQYIPPQRRYPFHVTMPTGRAVTLVKYQRALQG